MRLNGGEASPRTLAVPQALPDDAGPRRLATCLLRGSFLAVTTCCKHSRFRSDLLVRPGAEALFVRDRLVPAQILFARLSYRCDLRLLAPVEDDQAARRPDGAAPCRRPVLLLYAGGDPRRQARLCDLLSARIVGEPAGRAQAVGRRHEFPRRACRRAGGDFLGRQARRSLVPAGVRLCRGQRADGLHARAAGELCQWRAVGPRDRRVVGHGVPDRRGSGAPPEPALPGNLRGPADADHHDGAVLADACALSPRAAGGRLHHRHGNRTLR